MIVVLQLWFIMLNSKYNLKLLTDNSRLAIEVMNEPTRPAIDWQIKLGFAYTRNF